MHCLPVSTYIDIINNMLITHSQSCMIMTQHVKTINHTRLHLIHSEWCLFMISPSSFKVEIETPKSCLSWTNGSLQTGKDSDFVRFKVLVFLHLLRQTLAHFPSSDVCWQKFQTLDTKRHVFFVLKRATSSKIQHCRISKPNSTSIAWSCMDMDVSKNGGTPKSSILIGFSIINHPFWGSPNFGNNHIVHNNSIQQRDVYSVK